MGGEREIYSLQAVKCPSCSTVFTFTDSYDDFEEHHRRYPTSQVGYLPGIEMGSWRPVLELKVKGRSAKIQRDDMAFPVFPVLCMQCRKVYFAHLFVTNAAAVQKYEEFVRPKFPPKRDGDEVVPDWGMVGFTPVQFLDELAAIRNPMVRAAAVRRIQGAGWASIRLGGQEVPIEQYVETHVRRAPEPDQ
jgi:hypothetical protein